MRQNPGFDVNMEQGGGGYTHLHYSCHANHSSSVVPLLLAHPDIDVNVEDRYGYTPVFVACRDGHTPCVRELLEDSGVKVNEPVSDRRTPLRCAAFLGHLDVIKWWIASGREMDLGKPGDVYRTDAIGFAKMYDYAEVATLLERFKSDASQTRHAVRVELGLLDELAAEMFALVVFVSDGLLRIIDTAPSPAARYLSIATQLPLELQMVLCFRQVGSAKEIIPGRESEAAFRSLARELW